MGMLYCSVSSPSDLRRGSEWEARVLGSGIIVILYVSAVNLCGAQTLVIAATSWGMFEEMIMVPDNEGKKGLATSHRVLIFFLYSLPPLRESSYSTLHHAIISVSFSSSVMSSSYCKSLIDKWIIIGWMMFCVSAWTLDCWKFQLFWGNKVCVCTKPKQ